MSQERNRAVGNRRGWGGRRGNHRGFRPHNMGQENVDLADNRGARGRERPRPFHGGANRGRGLERDPAADGREPGAAKHPPRSASHQPQSGHRPYVNFTKLRLMDETVTENMAGEIMLDKSGFPQALNNEDLFSKPDAFEHIVSIIVKSIAYDSKENESLLLLNKVKSSKFFPDGFSTYYSKLLTRLEPFDVAKTREAFADSVKLLKIILERFPSRLEDVMPPYSMVNLILNQNENVFADDTKKMAEDIHLLIGHEKQKRPPTEEQFIQRERLLQPPDDFRSLGIFPNFDKDLACTQDPFLRPIETKGGFQDVEHYLDVHFRLLREDFVRPLRNGIKDYLELEKGKTLKKITEVRIYKRVKILNPLCQQTGIIYRIQFDVENLKRVNWKTTKRFIYGSLLCLSNNNFQNVVMATVEHRKPEDLANGIVHVKFEDESEPLRFDESKTFVMLETTAFFEAYRHVLECLVSVDPETIPFQDAIVHCRPTVKPPAYLKRRDAKIFEIKLSEKAREEEIMITDEEMPDDDKRNSLKFDILNEFAWPSAATLGLDETQLCALRNALTSDLSVVQGPPGTGKTFLGLKIVEILLENWVAWNVDGRPILVVCYTNHALDQFLEGIHKFLKKGIVRIGGRSKSELMKEFNLSQLRHESRMKKNVPKEIFGRKHDLLQEMKKKQEKIEKAGASIESLENGLVDETSLGAFMTQGQLISLESVPCFSGTSRILQWLQINEVGGDFPANEGQGDDMPLLLEDEEEEVEEENIDLENEADLEEHMRRMDNLDVELRLRLLEQETRRKNNMREAAKKLVFHVDQIKRDSDEWEIQKGQKKNLMKRLKRCLTNSDAMSNGEADAIYNVWGLSLKDKWRLYRCWLNKYKMRLKMSIVEDIRTYNLLCQNLKSILSSEDEWIMREARVIGMTTTCAARNRKVLNSVRPRVVIVEEAAEVLESHIMASLNPDCQHLILIGDHLQLRPSANVYKLGTMYHLNCSLFERLVNNKFPYSTLEKQHRMRPEISDFARITYPKLRDDESVCQLENIKGVSTNIFFINHHEWEVQDVESMSACNLHEAKFLARFCRYLTQQGYSNEQITILTPYSGQMFEIRKHMPKQIFQGVRICPVDNYQGEENDIILLSLVRSNDVEKIGFLKESNRLNVAMTRAKKGLYVIGNFDMLKNTSNFLREVYKKAAASEKQIMGKSLPLCCQNHPDARISAATDKDFDRAPEGGCTLPCRYRLPCGHTCTRICHAYDKYHVEIQCIRPCQKILAPCQHRCSKKCFEKCGQCELIIEKKIPKCGHVQRMKCHVQSEKFTCLEKCSHALPCGHPCNEVCGRRHTVQCMVTVRKHLECGHLVHVPCHKSADSDIQPCHYKCSESLKCGHPCSGTCGDCFAGRVHRGCTGPCERNLVCGHRCRSGCSEVCPPCRMACQIKCSHNDCRRQCGTVCDPCNEPCSWSCNHQRCTRLCHEECDRRRCNVPCRKRLRCGHECAGLCGETCPRLCRICDEAGLTEIFFGTEEEKDARFIELTDCHHVLEFSGLDQWVDEKKSGDGSSAIVPLCCPKCKTPIQNNNRYRPEIKSIQGKIEKVKLKICGSKAELEAKRRDIVSSLRGIAEPWVSDAESMVATGNFGLAQLENIRCAVEFVVHLRKLRCRSSQESVYRDKLKSRIVQSYSRLSNQECYELQNEISRLKLVESFATCKQVIDRSPQPRLTDRDRRAFLEALSTLEACKLESEREKEFRDVLERTKRLSGGLGISEEERLQIVRALDVKTGAWFECPNGHVYAIGDCGGATVESRCNECNAEIGGSNHALRTDNRWNRAMDHATGTAWPGTAMNPNGR